ncbi:MAG: flavin reductase [Pseudonocardiaceae bacterium]|nr:flavin reductase [Pseudonocardiaceae bacterium]
MASRNPSASIDTVGDVGPSSSDAALAEDFKAAFRNFPAGVAIITADGGGRPAGLTATSVSSVSVEPALVVFSLSSSSSAAPLITSSDTVVIHLLGADQVELAKRFATSGIDRFADGESWTRLATGEPVLSGVDCWLRGRIAHRMEAGSSTVVIVRVLRVRTERPPGSPLVYRNRRWYSLRETAVLA